MRKPADPPVAVPILELSIDDARYNVILTRSLTVAFAASLLNRTIFVRDGTPAQVLHRLIRATNGLAEYHRKSYGVKSKKLKLSRPKARVAPRQKKK